MGASFGFLRISYQEFDRRGKNARRTRKANAQSLALIWAKAPNR